MLTRAVPCRSHEAGVRCGATRGTDPLLLPGEPEDGATLLTEAVSESLASQARVDTCVSPAIKPFRPKGPSRIEDSDLDAVAAMDPVAASTVGRAPRILQDAGAVALGTTSHGPSSYYPLPEAESIRSAHLLQFAPTVQFGATSPLIPCAGAVPN